MTAGGGLHRGAAFVCRIIIGRGGTKRRPFFCREGVSPVVGRLIRGMDGDRLGIVETLGNPILRVPQISIEPGNRAANSCDEGRNPSSGFTGIIAGSGLPVL